MIVSSPVISSDPAKQDSAAFASQPCLMAQRLGMTSTSDKIEANEFQLFVVVNGDKRFRTKQTTMLKANEPRVAWKRQRR